MYGGVGLGIAPCWPYSVLALIVSQSAVIPDAAPTLATVATSQVRCQRPPFLACSHAFAPAHAAFTSCLRAALWEEHGKTHPHLEIHGKTLEDVVEDIPFAWEL